MLQGVFWATATADNPPAEVASRVNHYVCERSTPDKYATLFYGIFDPSGRINYVNAGHNPPMLVKSDGQVLPLGSENLPIGMFAEAEYKESNMDIACGDTLVMYTDGVTEAANSDDEMYGEERLAEFLASANGQELEQVRDRLLQSVKAFAGGEPQSDDITVVAARRM
jgi:sigma-B regulation protein RsbU (phosphoserine phosphatase)